MASEWVLTTFDAIAQAEYGLVDGPFGSNLPASEFTHHGVPVIRGSNLSLGQVRFRDDEFVYVSERTAQRLARSLCRSGDIVFTKKGTLGQVGFVPDHPNHPKFLLSSNQMRLRVDPQKADPLFVYYYSSSPAARMKVIQDASITGVPKTNLTYLRSFPILLPPLDEQKAIARVLGVLDDRIDLFRSMNQTLESIAKAIFKSWFIDFDPVRVKAEGGEPSDMDLQTASLFAADFIPTVLGPVPEGWAVSTLSQHVEVDRGLSYKGSGLCSKDEGTPMHNLNSINEGGGYKYDGIKFYDGEFKDRHLAFPGDIIVANTEQGHEHRLIGFPAIVPAKYSESIFSHHIYRVRLAAGSPLTRTTLYYLLMAPVVRDQIIACTNGSTVNGLQLAGLQIPRFICPPAVVARAFENIAAPMVASIESNVERSRQLADLRDTLLPRLVSGQLRIPEAQAAVEEALTV